MPTKVKPLADVVLKWAEVTPTRSSYYLKGVATAGADWEAKASAAGAAYKAAVSAGNIDKMFTGGIKKAGSAKYTRKATTVGADRFGPGVTAAKDDYNTGVAPMLETIAAVDMPARQPRGNVANQARSVAFQIALNKKRLALRAAGA